MAAEQPRTWRGLVVPALVLPLLGIQFALAFRGFDRPHEGVLGLLEAPGALLGWGGVLVLAVLVAWLLAGWWGRDLFGLQGLSGLAVRLIGCIALGVAVGGLAGLAAGPAGGGRIGASLADMLEGSPLGTALSVVLLLLMGIPSLVLSLSPFFGTPPPAPPRRPPTLDDLAELSPPPGLFQGSARPGPRPRGVTYPQRRYDEDGNEIPMTLPGHDVGPVRFVDEDDEAEEEAPAPSPPPLVEVPDRGERLADGVRFADEPEEREPDGAWERAAEREARKVPLMPGVRFADEVDEPEEEAPAPDAADEEDRDPRAAAPAPTGPVRDVEFDHDEEEEDSDEDLEEEHESDEEEGGPEEEEEEPAAPSTGRSAPAVFTPAPVTLGEAPTPKLTGDVGLDALKDEDAGAQYRAKLAGSGMFDEARPPEPPAPPPQKKSTPKKPAARKTTKKAKKKKTTAAAGRPQDEAPEEADPKRKARGPKAATPEKKAVPAKKAGAKKGSAAKGAGKAPAETPPAARKGSRAPAGARDESYRKAVEVAFERGAASSVLLSRRLGIGYAQARKLIEALVADGILGEMTPSGSRPLLISASEWKKRD